MKSWYRFQNATDDASTVDIHIVDFIGSWDDDWIARNWGYEMGVTAKAFIDELAKLPDSVKNLRVHINSPGGDIQGGVNIANALREQQRSKGRSVETYIDGIAASIASVIAMAGSKVYIADNALVMIHNPWSIAIGEASEMRKVADILDTMRGQIVATYGWHSALEPNALEKLMDAETWMNADEAIANGLATDKVEGLRAAASIDRRAAARLKVPDQYKARVDAWLTPAPEPKTAATTDQVIELCAAAGLDLAFAATFKGTTLNVDEVRAKVTSEKSTREAASARARDIRALCVSAQQPELADGYIHGAMSVADVKAHLTVITAKQDKGEINPSLDLSGGEPANIAKAWKDSYARASRPFGARTH